MERRAPDRHVFEERIKMGMKIKKAEQPQLRNLPVLKVRYTMAVPLIGIVDILTMGSFFMNPATDGMIAAKVFFVVFALVGVGFTVWGLFWKLTVDGKRIRVRPVFGKTRELPFSDLASVEIHKKKRNGSLVYYELFDVRGESIVKVYPLMKDSATLLERMKRLGIKIGEKCDQ